MELSLVNAILGLSIGIIVGWILQRGRACTNSAFRNLLISKNSELFLFVLVTVTIELIGYQLLASLNLTNFKFQSNPIEMSYVLLPMGGFIFGLGMVFAGGCAGGTCYRIGEGSINAIIAFIGFVSGLVLIEFPLNQLSNNIWNNTLWTINNETPSLEQVLPRWIWTIFALGITSIFVLRYHNLKTNNLLELSHLLKNWNPINTGVLLGIFGVFARFTSTLSGREFGLSTTDGIASLVQTLVLFDPIDWIGTFILGLMLGSFVSAYKGKEWKLSIPKRNEIIRFYGGGILLGSGAMLAKGCNFGHIFGGIPELGLSSIFAFLAMILGNWFGSYVFYIKLQNGLPKSSPRIVYGS
ncbi:MAG: YeeE/YedE family protein [Candidatus Kariarchaeaceae archaeon]